LLVLWTMLFGPTLPILDPKRRTAHAFFATDTNRRRWSHGDGCLSQSAMAHISGRTVMVVPESHSYSGAWPVTVSHSQFGNGTGCLTPTQGASGGSASLVFGNQKYPYGSFVVVDDILVVNITQPLYGQNGALMFIAHANRGHIGQGVYENIDVPLAFPESVARSS
jgi:hypothetical protein